MGPSFVLILALAFAAPHVNSFALDGGLGPRLQSTVGCLLSGVLDLLDSITAVLKTPKELTPADKEKLIVLVKQAFEQPKEKCSKELKKISTAGHLFVEERKRQDSKDLKTLKSLLKSTAECKCVGGDIDEKLDLVTKDDYKCEVEPIEAQELLKKMESELETIIADINAHSGAGTEANAELNTKIQAGIKTFQATGDACISGASDYLSTLKTCVKNSFPATTATEIRTANCNCFNTKKKH